LLEIRLTSDVRYRFCPGTDRLRTAACDVLAAYRADPIAVIRAVSPEMQHLRDFSDAFRIRWS
jgi:hypothetical protein